MSKTVISGDKCNFQRAIAFLKLRRPIEIYECGFPKEYPERFCIRGKDFLLRLPCEGRTFKIAPYIFHVPHSDLMDILTIQGNLIEKLEIKQQRISSCVRKSCWIYKLKSSVAGRSKKMSYSIYFPENMKISEIDSSTREKWTEHCALNRFISTDLANVLANIDPRQETVWMSLSGKKYVVRLISTRCWIDLEIESRI